MAKLSLRHVSKRYPNGFWAVKDFNLEMEDGEFVILTGSPKCGKSTVLRMIAGAEDVTEGILELDGKPINDVEPKDREIAMVFQYYSLYKNMTVYDNLSFGMKLKKCSTEQIEAAVKEAADMLGLEELLNRRLKILSEGQKKRVALGRAIIRKPKLFLFDEPLNGLDEKVQVQIRTEIEKLHERLIGRYALHDIVNPTTGELIVDNDTLITPDIADKIINAGINKVEVRSVLECKTKHGVCAKCYGMGLATRKEVNIGEAVGIIAAQSIGEPGTQLTMRTFHTGGVAGGDITQGLPRVEELFEARKPKGLAVISEIDGTVKIEEVKKRKEVTVTSKDNSKTYVISFGSKLKVKEGDQIKAGDPITEGSINPNEILDIKGPEGVYNYLTSEVQKVYRNQGVDINDKHIEVIGRQMLKRIRVDDNGDTSMFAGSLVDIHEFNEENEKIKEKGLRPATGTRVLLGITKASLATESFLSAASFQETTRVLTEAAIKGKVDSLIGLKENVIIGKLIPAGTGMPGYRNIKINTEEQEEQTGESVE